MMEIFLLSKQMKKDSVEKTIKSSFNFVHKANRRLRGHSTHPDLQYRTEEQTSSVLSKKYPNFFDWKVHTARWCVLPFGQIPTIYLTVTTVRERNRDEKLVSTQVKRFQESVEMM